MNGDGKMDINEFSVACKLINLRLKGMEMPKSLPPQLLQSGNTAAMGMMQPPNSLPLQGGMGMPGKQYGQSCDGQSCDGQRSSGLRYLVTQLAAPVSHVGTVSSTATVVRTLQHVW